MDRHGARAVLLPSTLVLGLCLAAIPGFVGELWQLALLFLLIGTLGVGTNTVTYMHVLAAWFDRRRGLAIGIGMAGMGLGLIYVPIVVQSMIDSYGWRAGYYALAAIGLVRHLAASCSSASPTRPPNWACSPTARPARAIPDSASQEVGLELSAVLRTVDF